MRVEHDGRCNIVRVVDTSHAGEKLTQSYQIDVRNWVETVVFPGPTHLRVNYGVADVPTASTLTIRKFKLNTTSMASSPRCKRDKPNCIGLPIDATTIYAGSYACSVRQERYRFVGLL